MLLLVQYTLIFASVLILVALGGCISERSGVINLGLEGIMVMGAMGGALAMRYLPAGSPAIVIILGVVLAAALIGYSAAQNIRKTGQNILLSIRIVAHHPYLFIRRERMGQPACPSVINAFVLVIQKSHPHIGITVLGSQLQSNIVGNSVNIALIADDAHQLVFTEMRQRRNIRHQMIFFL